MRDHQAWLQGRYAVLAETYRARGWEVPVLGEGLDAQNVLHAMAARLTGRPPLVVRRGEGLVVRDRDAVAANPDRTR